MRFKVVLKLNRELSGSTLPISYQYELSSVINWLLTSDKYAYRKWLEANNLTEHDAKEQSLYSLSNLYVPHLHVFGDRMKIQVPRVQFWISFHHGVGTQEYLDHVLQNRQFDLGDQKSHVNFNIDAVEQVSPVGFGQTMTYQTISPVTVLAIRSNNTLEYLDPENPYFPQFIFEELVERWEHINKASFTGSREYDFRLIAPPKRKAVSVNTGNIQQKKVISYMIKFEMTMDTQLHELAYDLGIGNELAYGFGYIELLYKD